MSTRSRTPTAPRRAARQVLPLASAAGLLIGGAAAAVPAPPGSTPEPLQAALHERVAAVRKALAAAELPVVDVPVATPSWTLAQASTWTNWPKWSKWSNWANK